MKKRITYLCKLLALAVLVMTNNEAGAQVENFNITVQNLTQTASNRLEFDVYLLDTDPGQPFELAGCQLGFLFNSLIYTGGTISVAIDNTGSGLNPSQRFTATPDLVTSLDGYPNQTLIRLAGQSPPGAGSGTIISTSGYGTLLTHFILTSTVNFVAESTPNVVFCSSSAVSPLYPTIVSAYIGGISTALTVTPGTNALVNGNPVLNPPLPGTPVANPGSNAGCTQITANWTTAANATSYRLDVSTVNTFSSYVSGYQDLNVGNVTNYNVIGLTAGTAYYYRVRAVNAYGTSVNSNIVTYATLPATPLQPGPISGTTAQCPGLTGQVYSINPVTDATTYNWTLPSGWTITNGLGTTSITVTTGSSGQNGDISVTASNSCGTSVPRSLAVTVSTLSVTPTAIAITNNNTCFDVNKTLTVVGGSLGTGAVWQWFTGSCGGTAVGTGSSIVVNPAAGTSTVYYVRASGTCNTTTCAEGTVVVTPNVGTPSVPVPSFTTICQGSPNTSYTTSATNATSYNWSVSGSGNTISGTGTTGTVTWSPSFTGVATISVTANGCGGPSPSASTTVTVLAPPSAPVIGTITPPTCILTTGSVQLTGLPSSGTWTIRRTPGGNTYTGTGTSTVISSLLPNTYTFTVEIISGCASPQSAGVIIPPQPPTPTPPVVGAITPPTCTVSTGSVALSGLPAEGEWTLTRYPGTVQTKGTGASTVISGLPKGDYNFTVTNQYGCTSLPSDNVAIPEPPPTPTAPQPGTITQPTCAVPTGSVVLTGLPSGSWTLLPSYSMSEIGGSGTSTTVTGVPAGTHTFRVTNQFGCTSPPSSNVVINTQPPTPTPPVVGAITQPTCAVATGSVALSGLPSSGTWTVTRNPGGGTTSGTGTTTLITGIPAGNYTFTVTNASGCTSAPSAVAVIETQPPSPPIPSQTVDCTLGAGNAVVTVTSPTGAGLEYRIDALPFQPGNVFTGVSNGSHTITVRNSFGCTTTGPVFSVTCGCANPPTLTLSSTGGSTCGTEPVTVTNNTFGGSATSVTLGENGSGTLIPLSTSTTPFSFIYTPAPADAGRVVTITVTTNNPLGSPCIAATATYTLAVNAIPAAPSIGTRTQPSCNVPTGGVILNGLPSTGTWTLTRSPDGVITTGTGTSTTISGLNPGTYSFTVTSEPGCTSPSSANVVINPQPPTPTPPVIGTITQPTCAVSTGSVVLTGLPESGTWTVTRNPGGITRNGTGTSVTITTILPGSYTFTVTNSFGCISAPSGEVVINAQPPTPSPPAVGTITPPTCTEPTGSVVLLGLPSSGTWTLTRYPGTITTTGTGTSTTITGLATGTYNYTVTNQSGCTSLPSANVVIPAQPPTPTAPVIGTVTQPTYAVPTGSVVLSGLPAGAWIITRYPGEVTTTGSGTSTTISGLPGGVFRFTVTNSFGCTSPQSNPVTISTPGPPTLIINDPPAVCSPSTVNLTDAAVTEGSTAGLIYTYWTNPEATNEYLTPQNATTGTYYIKGTTVSGFFDIKPVNVTVDQMPVPYAGPDKTLDYVFRTTLEATLLSHETGVWSIVSGEGSFANINDPQTVVSSLTPGINTLLWTVTSGVCPAVSDQVVITVNDLILPTLITPNMDGRNDYFVIRGLETLGRTEIVIFDRRGLQVYKDADYKNDWDGVDYKNNPLPDDTYFFVLRSASGRSVSGYIVIRR